jgi:hypothetical protein
LIFFREDKRRQLREKMIGILRMNKLNHPSKNYCYLSLCNVKNISRPRNSTYFVYRGTVSPGTSRLSNRVSVRVDNLINTDFLFQITFII